MVLSEKVIPLACYIKTTKSVQNFIFFESRSALFVVKKLRHTFLGRFDNKCSISNNLSLKEWIFLARGNKWWSFIFLSDFMSFTFYECCHSCLVLLKWHFQPHHMYIYTFLLHYRFPFNTKPKGKYCIFFFLYNFMFMFIFF